MYTYRQLQYWHILVVLGFFSEYASSKEWSNDHRGGLVAMLCFTTLSHTVFVKHTEEVS